MPRLSVALRGLTRHPAERRAGPQNNLAINRSVAQVAKHFIDGNQLKEGMLNRVSAVVRAYDPCLSCSTHADGTLEMEIKLIGADGTVLDRMG